MNSMSKSKSWQIMVHFAKVKKMIKKKSVYKACKEYENKKVYLNRPNLNSDNKAIRYSG